MKLEILVPKLLPSGLANKAKDTGKMTVTEI